jgi:4-amino-4-deoxy-L-arabinose transferase-like glycosyltransferase
MHNRSLSPLPKYVITVVIVSFFVQVALIGLLHEYRTRPIEDHFAFGWEMGRVARSIAQGQGFSNPYDANTGPTAWEPPIYPYLMGGVFKLFGIFTYASAWTLLIINSLFASLTTIPIFLIAARTFDARVARWSTYAWALNPYVWYWSIHWIWDTTLTPLLLTLIFLVTLQLEDWPRLRGWALFAILWGIGALANPSMLAFLPFCGLWTWRRRFKNGLPSISGVVLSSAIFFLVLSPWLIRNYEIFGRFVFIRDDFGLQFRLGNSKGAEGMLMAYLQPNLNKLELEKFQRLGELKYGVDCKRIAIEWIREHPEQFAIVSLRRFFYYWNGVPKPTDSRAPWDFRNSLFLAWSVLAIWGAARAVRQRVCGRWLFAGLLLTYPTTYYFVFPHARYRHPIEPELVILAVYLIFQTSNLQRRREQRAVTPLAASDLL